MVPTLEELAAAVTALQDRDAIWQCMVRYARGVDRFDRDLILSAYHPDAWDDHGKFVGSPEDFVTWVTGQHHQAHIGHMHNLCNHYCEIDGDIAHAETYFLFAGITRQGTPCQLIGGRYFDRLEKRNGEWKIAYRTLVREWNYSDERPDPEHQSSYTSTRAYLSPQMRAFMDECPGPRRDRDDPSYRRPLDMPPERIDSWGRLVARMASGGNNEG